MTDSAVLDKVRKLLRLSASSNANEAALAAAKAQELLDRHQLAQTMLDLDEPAAARPDETIEDFGKKDAPLENDGGKLDRWRAQLAMSVARWNACKVYCTGAVMHLIGRPSDADTVRYLYSYLRHEVDRLTDEEGKGCGRTWRNNFRLGVVSTIQTKLHAQHQQTIKDFRAEVVTAGAERGESSTALMRVNHAIAKLEDRRFEVERWTKDHLKLYSRTSGQSAYDQSARERGKKAGQRISIGGAKGRLTSAAKKLTA